MSPSAATSTFRTVDLAPLVRAAGGALLFLMLFVPTTYRPVKGALLAFLLFALAARAVKAGRIALNPDVAVLALGYSLLGLIGIAYGQAHGAPGALRMSTVYVAWPLVYTFLASGFDREEVGDVVGAALVAAAVAVPVYSLMFVSWAAGYLPDALYVPLDLGQAIGFYGAYVEFNLYSISSLLFLTPFLLTLIAIPPVRARWWNRPVVLWAAVLLNMATVLLTGRRALLLVVGLTPVFVAVALWLLPRERRRAAARRCLRLGLLAGIAGLAGLLVLSALGRFSFLGIWRMFVSGFQFTTDPVAMVRNEQFWDLVTGWSRAPVLGVGHGMPAPRVVRSFEMPWAYELSYVALLYHTGVVGLAAYGFGFAWLAIAVRRVAQTTRHGADLLLPVTVGMLAFLVANATNPYLVKWDYLWTVFLPIALVNLGRHEARRFALARPS